MSSAPRLELRPFEPSDAPRVLDIHSRLDVIRWLGSPPHVPMASLDQARIWIGLRQQREVLDPFDVTRAIVDSSTGVVAGTVSVARAYRRNGDFLGEYEVGWHLHPDSTGRGFATAAARLMLDDVFSRGLPEVWCGMFVGNEPSRRVAERLGLPFVSEGPDPWYDGDSWLYKVTGEQWSAIRERPDDCEPPRGTLTP